MEASRIQGTKPSFPLKAYAGTYENDMYGKVRIVLEGDRLVAHLSSKVISDLAHWHYETFQATSRDRAYDARVGKMLFTFAPNAMGKVPEMNMEDMLVFRRLPD